MQNKYTSAEYVIQKLKHRREYMTFLIWGVQKFGVKKFNPNLKEIGLFKRLKNDKNLNKEEFSFFSEQENKIVDFILKIVVNEWKDYKVTKNDLFESTRRLEYVRAREMAIVLIDLHTSITNFKIGEFFNRCRQVVYYCLKRHSKKKKEKNKHTIYFSRYKRLYKLVLAYKKKNKLI